MEQEEKRNQNWYQFGFFFRCHYQKFIAKTLSLFSSRCFMVSSVTFKVTIWFNFFLNFILFLNFTILVLPNIKMNPPQVYMCSPSWTLLPPPSPYHPSGSSQCNSPKHPVSCIEPGLASCFIHDIIHVSMLFAQISPPSPSPTESIRLIYTSVSLLLSRTQGYCYHLPRTALWSSNPAAGHTHWGNQKGKRHVYPSVHRSTVYNSQDMEAT